MYPLRNFFRFLFSLLSLPAISALLTDSKAYVFMLVPLCIAFVCWTDYGIMQLKKAVLMRYGKQERVKIASIALCFPPIPFRNGGSGYLATLSVHDRQGQTYTSPLLFIHLSRDKQNALRRYTAPADQENPLSFLLEQPVTLHLHFKEITIISLLIPFSRFFDIL